MSPKIWQQPNHEQVTTATPDDNSAHDYQVQPPIKKIEIVYLDSTGSMDKLDDQVVTPTSNQAPPETPQLEMEEKQPSKQAPPETPQTDMEEEHETLSTSQRRAQFPACMPAISTILKNFKWTQNFQRLGYVVKELPAPRELRYNS